MGKFIRGSLWVISILGSLAGVLVIVATLGGGANGAPQEAVGIALGLACAVIPYCISRAVSEIGK